jgi:hypothetical protein
LSRRFAWAPARQYGRTTDSCALCGTALSRYNPHTVCGPCRLRVVETLPGQATLNPAGEVELESTWEEFERRPQLPQRVWE